MSDVETEDLLAQALLAHRDLCAALRRKAEVEAGLMSAGLMAQFGQAAPDPDPEATDAPDAE